MVEKQAVNYANVYAELALGKLNTVKHVKAFVFTNEYAQPIFITNKEL